MKARDVTLDVRKVFCVLYELRCFFYLRLKKG